jgi:hypothetical protein
MNLKSSSTSNWDKEYDIFLNQEAVSPSPSLSQKIKIVIHQKLNPSKFRVMIRLLMTHGIIAMGVLLVCPHFGVTIIPGFQGLTALLMRVNHLFCMSVCGFLVVAPSLFYASMKFKAEDLKVFYRVRVLFIFILVTLTLMCLMVTGAQSIVLKDVCAWSFGAFLGGWAIFEIGIKLNRKFIRE